MGKLSKLKKELKQAEKEIRKNKNVSDNKELVEILKNEIKVKENLRLKGHKTSFYDKLTGKFSKYDPDIKQLNNVKYVGHNIMRIRFNQNKFDNNQQYTVKKVQQIGNQLSDYLQTKNINGKVMTSLLYGDLGWRSGYFTDIGDDIKLYEPNDSGLEMDIPKNIKSFVCYVVVNPKAQGGNDIHNDCLYNVLERIIYNFDRYFKTPESFKKYLGLKRDDKVPISLIGKVEEKLKIFQINVRGDYIHTSIIKSEKQINLTLINEHYELDKTRTRKPICKNISYNEKIPLLYDKITYEAYDGEIVRKLSKEEYNDISNNFKSKYIIIHRQTQKDKTLTLKEEYDELIPIINTLKKESNGYINLYKSGSYKNAGLDLFDRFTKFMSEPDEILQDESVWIHEASKGSALIWAEPYEGELYKYDVKSLYPHLMTLPTLKFPIKRGEFIILDKFGEFFQFGIYRCVIKKSDDSNINKLFKFNGNHYYTSISLEHAKKLGLDIQLIQDSKPNFLYYSREKLITFNEVFKPYVEFLFELKDKGIDKAKFILNILWGALCEIDKKRFYDDKEINIQPDEEIMFFRPSNFDDDVDVIVINKINKKYKTNYARLCPFLLSKGRSHMSNIMFENREHIHRIQTDGFLSDKLIHSNIDVKIGELKYEGFTESGIITNCLNKVPVHY